MGLLLLYQPFGLIEIARHHRDEAGLQQGVANVSSRLRVFTDRQNARLSFSNVAGRRGLGRVLLCDVRSVVDRGNGECKPAGATRYSLGRYAASVRLDLYLDM